MDLFLIAATSMCLVFMAMTISFEQLRVADNKGLVNSAASISALVWFFAYTPCYNIGDNATLQIIETAVHGAALYSVSAL